MRVGGDKTLLWMEEDEQSQPVALMHFPKTTPPQWQEPGKVQGRILQPGVVASVRSGDADRLAPAPDLQLE